MKHKFLFEPAKWQGKGLFWNRDNSQVTAEGITLISHDINIWRIDGVMRIFSDPPFEFENQYEIQPFITNEMAVKWRSVNPTVGILIGTFTVVEDTIISLYHSEDGKHRGCEHMNMVGLNEYQTKGVFFEGATRLSSWKIHLHSENI